MKLTILITMLLAAWFTLQGCGEDMNGEKTSADRTPLSADRVSALCAAGEWRLQRMVSDDQQLALQPDSAITFSCDAQGRVAGMASVNRYSGSFSLDEGELNWQGPGFITTKMAGPPALMQQEQDFLRILATTSQGYFEGATLVLQNTDESNRLEFSTTPSP